MSKRSRKENIAAVFAKRTGGPRAAIDSATSTPSSGAVAAPSPSVRAERETSNSTTSPSATLNLTALVGAMQSNSGSSDAEDGTRDPTSIIGMPATGAAYIDRVANIFGLAEDNRAGLHSFSKLAPAEQSIVLEAGFMVTLAVVSSTAAFGKESITQLGKDIKEIKGMVMANWEPDDATIHFIGVYVRRVAIESISGYGEIFKARVMTRIKRKPGDFGLATYPTDNTQLLKIEKVVQDKINSAKSLLVKNITDSLLQCTSAKTLTHFMYKLWVSKIGAPSHEVQVRVAFLRRVQMEFIIFPVKDRGGFWKQVDDELAILDADMNAVEHDQRSQAWTNLRNNGIKDEIDAFDNFRKYIKDNPESEAATMIKSAGRKRKAFCILEGDEGSEGDGENDEGSVGAEGGDPDRAVGNHGDSGMPENVNAV